MRLPLIKLLKTNIEKMSLFRLSIIFMKTSKLYRYLHYVDEKKGEGSFPQICRSSETDRAAESDSLFSVKPALSVGRVLSQGKFSSSREADGGQRKSPQHRNKNMYRLTIEQQDIHRRTIQHHHHHG